MSHRVKADDGRIWLFNKVLIEQRGDYWHFRMWLDGESKYVRESLKTRDLETAKKRAEDRYIELRANPYPKFESISFVLGNPEIDDADRDALINIFLGQPVWIQNLPGNINSGSFQGYIEGWTFRASLNNLSVTFNASPINFSQVAVKWEQVNAAETWNTLSPTLTWINAIGVVA